MKAIYKNIAMATLALSAVACSQEDDFSSSYLNDSDAVRITAQVGMDDVIGGFTRSNPLGTAEEQTKFNTGDQIAVAAGTQAPVVYQLGTDGWNPVGDAYLKWQTNEMNVTAYYPVGKNNASATTFTVPTAYTEESPIADADYMTYSGSQSKGDDKAINLTMERKMVRIVVDEIFFNDQFAKDYSVTAIKIHANTIGYADGEPVAGDIQVLALQQGGGFYALLAPTTENEDATFLTMTVAHKTNTEDVHTLTVKGIPTTTAGNSYNYSLTVGKDMAKIGTVTIKDWTGAILEGGTAEEVIPNTFDATTMIPEQLNAAVTEALEYGHTELAITLAADADATMFSAITSALAADGIEEGSIDMTISGATTVPESAFDGVFGENPEACAVLRSVTLPDVIKIEDYGINYCPNLASVSAPKCEVLGVGSLGENNALTSVYLPSARIIGNSTGNNYGPFGKCEGLTEISLPEATTLGKSAFAFCSNLKTVYLPKVKEIIGFDAFRACDNLEEITLGALTTVNNGNVGTFNDVTTGNVALVLSPDQKAMNYDSSTKIYTAGTDAFDFNTTSFIGYTFKSITKQTQE